MQISELVRSLLEKRDVRSPEDIERFLNPDYATNTHDPFLLAGMDVAVARVFATMERGERIAIYADFDCDGIPGAAILWDFFTKIQYTDISVYMPHRDREGYGFHIDAIQKLANEGVKLIITVDVGTKANAAVAYAKEIGVDVIVTDHHEIDPSTELGAGGNEWRDIAPEKKNEQALSDGQVLKLSDVVLRIEKHYGFPVDIEWVIEGGTLYIVQSRPVTTLSKP